MIRDAICGQDLSRELYVFTLDYRGARYQFCSMKCRRAFQVEPGKYARRLALTRIRSRLVRFFTAEDREIGSPLPL